MQHTSESADCVSSSAESKQENVVAFLINVDQIAISVADIAQLARVLVVAAGISSTFLLRLHF